MTPARRPLYALGAFVGIVFLSVVGGLVIPAGRPGTAGGAPPALSTRIANPAAAYPAGTAGGGPGEPAGCAMFFPAVRTGARETVLTGVSAPAADDVWAVGFARDDSTARTVILHWDGTRWQGLPSPNRGLGINVLYAVAARAADDVWAVGAAGEGALATLILHWDGHTWQIVPSPNLGTTNNILRGVAVRAADDAWAVGSANTGEAQFTDLILHWDGHTWQRVATPGRDPGFNLLNAVAAPARDDTWAVGRGNSGVQILHWDGHAWLESAVPPLALLSELNAVAALSPRDVWAVGARGSGLALHWDGAAWRPVPVPGPGKPGLGLRGVAAHGAGDLWAVGETTGPQPWLVQGAGADWYLAPLPPTSAPAHLRALAAAPDGTLWAVGADHGPDLEAPVGSLEGPGTGAALILRQPPAGCPASPGGTTLPLATRPRLLSNTALQVRTGGGGLLWRDISPNKSLYTYDSRTGRPSLLTADPDDYPQFAADSHFAVWAAGNTITGLDLHTQEVRPLLTLPAPRQLAGSGIAVADRVLYYTNADAIDTAANGPAAEAATPTPAPYDGGLFAYDLRTGRETRLALHGSGPVVAGGVLLWNDNGRALYLRQLDAHVPDRVLDTAPADVYRDYQYEVSGGFVAWADRTSPETGIHLYDIRRARDRVLAAGRGTDPHLRGDWVVWTVPPVSPEPTTPGTEWAIRAYRISTGQLTTLVREQGGVPLQAAAVLDSPAVAYLKGDLYAELYILPLR